MVEFGKASRALSSIPPAYVGGCAQVQWLAAAPGRADVGWTRFGERATFREGLYRVSRDCYAWMVPNGSWGETNLGLIDCDGKSVLVDTCWNPKYTEQMLAASRPIIERSPIELVINTHADGDHCWGNQLFTECPIIATHACVRQMKHVAPGSLRALQLLGRGLCHLPVGGLEQFGHYVSQMLMPYSFRGVRLAQASEPFSGNRQLKVGATQILLEEVGPAHTDGDAIVYLPDQRVAYAGDILFVGVTPVAWAGPVERIVLALRRLLQLDVDVIVPGHGPLADKERVRDAIDYWDFVYNALHARCVRGVPPLAAVQEVLAGDDFRTSIFARWDSPERMLTNAHTLYREWDASLPPLAGSRGTLGILREQAAVAFALPEASPSATHRRGRIVR